jgi:integrase/recombinase XerD
MRENRALLSPFIRRFLLEYLVEDRNLSLNTQAGYRDTLMLLLPFVAERARVAIDQLRVDDITAKVVKGFLKNLQTERHVSNATRNQRLVAIHSLATFVGEDCPEHLDWCNKIHGVPFRRCVQKPVPYLNKKEIDAVLSVPDRRTLQGFRDHALLLFLFNSGARAEEAASLTIEDLTFGRSPAVKLLGKGDKCRTCPLWKETTHALEQLTQGRPMQSHVFVNRYGEPLTRSGIYKLVKRAAVRACQTEPSIRQKRLSPHTLRHSCATHMLKAGVDINTIRGWLGHVSVDTTNIYAEIDSEMKEKALEQCDVPGHSNSRRWHTDSGVMSFLKRLGRSQGP